MAPLPLGTDVSLIETRGTGGFVGATSDGGRTWTARTAGGPIISSLSCPTTADCWAASADVRDGTLELASTTDGGSTWTAPSIPSGISGGGGGISCPTTAQCLAPPFATDDGGGSWTEQSFPIAIDGGR